MNKCCVLLDPGHGADNYLPKGKFKRPLISLDSSKDKIRFISGSNRSIYDGIFGYYREDLGTLKLAAKTKKYLEEIGFKVYTTRDIEEDVNASISIRKFLNIPRYKRVLWSNTKWIKEYAREIKSDIFVSIHTNAGKGSGFSSFYYKEAGKELGQYILEELNKSLKLPIRRNEQHGYSILKNNSNNRSCLVECGFHDNPEDLKILLSQKGIDTIGQSIANGINSFAKLSKLI